MSKRSVKDALDEAVRSVAEFTGPRPPAPPFSPAWLLVSALGIAIAALTVAALATAAAVLVLYAHLGREGLSDFMTQARFDPPLKSRLAALAVSAIYAGVALATLAAARLRGGRGGWRQLLAARPGRWRGRGALPVAAATLGYAAIFTLVQVVGADHHLLALGPTDFLLLGTLVTNLVVLAPLAEELFFRGWLYTGLRARWTFLPAFLTTAAAFAAIHWDPNHRHMLRVLPLAMGVGLLREQTGGVRATFALHAAYNGIIVAITLAAT